MAPIAAALLPTTGSCAGSHCFPAVRQVSASWRSPRFTPACLATAATGLAVTAAAGSLRPRRLVNLGRCRAVRAKRLLAGPARSRQARVASACRAKDEGAKEQEAEKSIEEKFEDFTRVLPWFDFAADIQRLHSERRSRTCEEVVLSSRLQAARNAEELSDILDESISQRNGAEELPEVVEAVLRAAAAGSSSARATEVLAEISGRWEVIWSGAFSPLARWGLPRQCMYMQVDGGSDGSPGVVTAHSGLPLVLFGAYLWTSCAGELREAPAGAAGPQQVLIQFNRYWIDIGTKPRSDLGRIDGGFLTSRVAAFGAALLTPVLLEFGALKWLLERFGLKRVFEVEVPSPEGEDKTVKLEASLELYLTLLAMVAFPESLSTCPVPLLDSKAGLCVFEIPMLGPVGDLPRWLHPGGNSAALVARRLSEGEEPSLMR